MATAGDHILRVLRDAGVRHIFGVPGGGTVPMFTGTAELGDELRALLVRHEALAAVMADGYARASGQPVAVMGQGAFIGSNATFGMMEAFMSSSPMIVLGDTSDSGAMPSPVAQGVTGDYGHVDLLAMLRATTKYAALATTPTEAVLATQQAVRHATSGNPGPTAVVLRSAAITGQVDDALDATLHDPKRRTRLSPAPAAPEAVAAAVAALRSATAPVVVAGKGVHNARAHGALRSLAERLGAPVATSYKGKGAIEDTHPLAAGMMGTYGRVAANAAVRDADVVVVVGAKLTTADRAGGALVDPLRQTVVQVDVEPRNVGWAVGVDVALVGDCAVVLAQLLDALGADDGAGAAARQRAVAAIEGHRRTDPVLADPALEADSSPVMPQRLVRLLSEHLDPASNVTLDAGFNRVWMCLLHTVPRAGSLYAPGGIAGMGWALPAALGVKLARPDEPAVAVSGDGGFMMAVPALATAVEHGIDVTCVVFNDSGLGMVRHHQPSPVASLFGPTDHAAIARAFGGAGVRVEDSRDLPAAIKEAQATDGLFVIDVVTDPSADPDVYRARPHQPSET